MSQGKYEASLPISIKKKKKKILSVFKGPISITHP